MRVKLFTFRYSSTLGGFDDTPLQDHIRDKEVLSVREHFFRVNDVPHLLCVVTWQDAVVPTAAAAPDDGAGPRSRKDRPDPTEGLDERERLLFNTVRSWRARKAREEGVPPYVILTNKELRAVIRAKPDSPTALGNVEGIGKAKVKRYGKEILAELDGHAAPAESSS